MNPLAGQVLSAALFLAQISTGPVARYTAVAEAVNNAGEKVRIDIVAWSDDADRARLAAAWNMTPLPAAGGARGGGRGAAPTATTGEPQGTAAGPSARGGAIGAIGTISIGPARGAAAAPRGARGGRGGGGGTTGEPATSAPASLLSALNGADTAGILWTSENLGYTIRYAYRIPQTDGGERVILATDRRLGSWNELWRPAAGATDYEFTVIELHMNAKGQGEGKASLTGKVAIDGAASTIALENYAGQQVLFKNVTRQSGSKP